MIFDILGCIRRQIDGRQIICIGQCSLSQRTSAARKTAGVKITYLPERLGRV